MPRRACKEAFARTEYQGRSVHLPNKLVGVKRGIRVDLLGTDCLFDSIEEAKGSWPRLPSTKQSKYTGRQDATCF
jgi:hypothetical protein